jgi:hypothetical protein
LRFTAKREESAISLSAKKRMLVDAAKADKIPVSPKKTSFIYRVYYWTLIPFGIIYTDDLLDTKIK